MIETTYDELEKALKSHQLRYYNFYNTDISLDLQQITRYYGKYQNDTINTEQIINAMFVDIESYTTSGEFTDDDIASGAHPINIITIIPSTEHVIHTYLLLFENNFAAFGLTQNMSAEEYSKFITDRQNEYVQQLKERKYIGTEYVPDDYTVNLYIYNDEKQLIIDTWNKIHEYDPDILTSWNGDNFDYPYMYNRCCVLFGEENVPKIMSRFGQITKKGNRIQFFEYTIADLLYMYKPRDEGGSIPLNCGSH